MDPSGSPLVLEVTDVAGGGDGIAHVPDGRVAFVRGGVPGDRVAVTVTADKARLVKADVSEVVEPSPHRVSPPCPHVADGCGGCGWQHIDLDSQRALKFRIVEEAARRIGHLEVEVGLAPALPTEGFRTTVRGLVVDGRFAFRAARSHDPVPVASCLVAHPALDELISASADAASGVTFGSPPRRDDAEVTLRVGAATGQRLARFSGELPAGVRLPDDVTVVDDDHPDGCIHDEVAGRRFRISADAFFQSRTDGAAALVDAVRAAGGDAWGSGRLADLYGGVGLFAGCLGAGMAITSVEASAPSSADARANLADLDATVVEAPVERWAPTPADLVVADPPRAGLGREAVSVIAGTGAARVVLVSCDAASFARDAALLGEAGYRWSATQLVDLFPHTPHVELVSRFERSAR